MNIHEALLYLNFANTLEVNGFDYREIDDFTEEANEALKIAERINLPVAILHQTGGVSSTVRSTQHYVLGDQTLTFEGDIGEVSKVRHINEHIIGEVYVHYNNVYISSRSPEDNSQRTVTVLKNVKLEVKESPKHKY